MKLSEGHFSLLKWCEDRLGKRDAELPRRPILADHFSPLKLKWPATLNWQLNQKLRCSPPLLLAAGLPCHEHWTGKIREDKMVHVGRWSKLQTRLVEYGDGWTYQSSVLPVIEFWSNLLYQFIHTSSPVILGFSLHTCILPFLVLPYIISSFTEFEQCMDSDLRAVMNSYVSNRIWVSL